MNFFLRSLAEELLSVLKRVLRVVKTPLNIGKPWINSRRTLVDIAYWARRNKALWDYAEVRPVVYGARPRFVKDCSGAVCWLYWCAGLNDPSGNNFSGVDTYTGTLLTHGRRITPDAVRAGDICILGAELPTAEQHAMMALSPGPDPVCFSHGQQGDPALVRVSVDHRSKTWVRHDLKRVRKIQWPEVK